MLSAFFLKFRDVKGEGRRISVLRKCNVGDITSRHKCHAAQRGCVCAAAVGMHLITRFCLTTLIRLSATDGLHTLPHRTTPSKQETPWVRRQPAENNGTGVLSITTGNSYFICCEVVVFSLRSLTVFLFHSFLSLPSSICVSLSLSLCNHILYTIGSQSNLMHRYSLIKLICRDPLFQSVLDSFMPPYQNAPTYTSSCSTALFLYVLIGSSAISQNAKRFAECYS